MTYDQAMEKVQEGLKAYRDDWVMNRRYPTRVRKIGGRFVEFTHSRPSSVNEYAPTDNDKQADDWRVMP